MVIYFLYYSLDLYSSSDMLLLLAADALDLGRSSMQHVSERAQVAKSAVFCVKILCDIDMDMMV